MLANIVNRLKIALSEYESLLNSDTSDSVTILTGYNYIVLYKDVPREIEFGRDNMILAKPCKVKDANKFRKVDAEAIARHLGEDFVACHWKDHVQSKIQETKDLLKEIECI